jgi:formamidopyrimidine-DNA glycosylase
MPELPEVETISQQLARKIKGKKIKKIKVRLKKIIQVSSLNFFKNKVEGVKIKKVWRRAKMIIIDLENHYSLVIHLKLSGQLLYSPKEKKEYPKHSHLIFVFADQGVLIFNDMRQFGYCKLILTQDLPDFFQEKKIGPEPLAKNFSLKKFKELLEKKSQGKIKPVLMDQSFLAGIGNIYAQEICWCARVLPQRKINTLTDKEIKLIYNCLIKILKVAIKDKGTTAADEHYQDTAGKKGKYAFKLKVYQKQGKKCSRCQKGIIQRINLAGRGTSYCPRCQK